MLSLAQSDLGETAARLLVEARGQTIVITDGDIEVGAIVSKDYLDQVRRSAFDRIHQISNEASIKVAAHAAELGITPEELVERLLQDDDE